MDRNKDNYFVGPFWKCARIGERLSPYVSIACVVMAVSSPLQSFASVACVEGMLAERLGRFADCDHRLLSSWARSYEGYCAVERRIQSHGRRYRIHLGPRRRFGAMGKTWTQPNGPLISIIAQETSQHVMLVDVTAQSQ